MRGLRGPVGVVCAAALAVAGISSCSGGGGPDRAAIDAKSAHGEDTVSPAPPGKYRTLPEPCGSIDPDHLKTLVPKAQDYAGVASLTYDTDRRVGCKWSGQTDQGNRSLQIDFERVVSYDPAVSDEAEAESEYDARLAKTDIPTVPPGTPTATPQTPPPTPTPPFMPSGSASAPASGASPGPGTGTGPGELAPRQLTGVGNTAFLDDVLKNRDSGVHRDITLVFRTANVIVTINYAQWSTDKAVVPTSADLQQGAQQVARELVKQIDR